MRKLFLLVLVMTTAALSASGTSLFRDEDTGLVVEMPEGMTRTWNLSNSELGLEFSVFQTNSDPLHVIVTGKVPMEEELVVDGEELFSQALSQLTEMFGPENPFSAKRLPSLANEEYPCHRIRFSYSDDEEEGQILIDLHLFFRGNRYTSFVGTAMQNLVEEGTEGIDAFSLAVLESVRFIDSE